MASPPDNPKKGILKQSGSVDHSAKKEIEWDEMNIIATYHPPGKDYGHMKVEEPPTPYNRIAIEDGEDDVTLEKKGSFSSDHGLDADVLARMLEAKPGTSVDNSLHQFNDEDEEDWENMTEEEREKRKAFLMKRKMHYNEFAAVQLAKKLLAEEEDEEECSKPGSPRAPSSGHTSSGKSPSREHNKGSKGK